MSDKKTADPIGVSWASDNTGLWWKGDDHQVTLVKNGEKIGTVLLNGVDTVTVPNGSIIYNPSIAGTTVDSANIKTYQYQSGLGFFTTPPTCHKCSVTLTDEKIVDTAANFFFIEKGLEGDFLEGRKDFSRLLRQLARGGTPLSVLDRCLLTHWIGYGSKTHPTEWKTCILPSCLFSHDDYVYINTTRAYFACQEDLEEGIVTLLVINNHNAHTSIRVQLPAGASVDTLSVTWDGDKCIFVVRCFPKRSFGGIEINYT